MQLVTDITHGLIVNVEATTDAIDFRQLEPALQRCKDILGRLPKQIVADGDYTNHASVQVSATAGVDFFGSWQDTWKPTEYDAHGRSGVFISSAFPYDAEQDVYLCLAGKRLTLHVMKNGENGLRTHVYRAPKAACRSCALRDQCGTKNLRDEAYLMLHDGHAAAAEFQKFVDHRRLLENFPWGAPARLQLGRAYMLSIDKIKAKSAYQDFLTFWKDADPDIPILTRAKAEYAELR